jgi:hypothetical protein
MIHAIKGFWKDEIRVTDITFSIVIEGCYLPIHFFPGNSIPLFNKVDKFEDVEVIVWFVFREVFTCSFYEEIWVFTTCNSITRSKREKFVTVNASLKSLFGISEKMLKFTIE